MCGIAGYSLSPDSTVDRTLAAQALLAGIADRGADAVGYAYRAPGETFSTVVKQRTPASNLLERLEVPQTASQALIHVRDYTKGHPSIPANNHPVRHGPVVGIHNGIIVNDDEILGCFECARAEPRMSVDSEAILALAAHSRARRPRVRGSAGRDGDGLVRRARARRPLPRPRRPPAALDRHAAAASSSSRPRSTRWRCSSATRA